MCIMLQAGFLIPAIRVKYSLWLQIKVSNHLSALPLSFSFSSPKHGVFSWSMHAANEDRELAPGGERLELSTAGAGRWDCCQCVLLVAP